MHYLPDYFFRMNQLNFTEEEATILYFVDGPEPSLGSTTKFTLHTLCILERAAPPEFEVFQSALEKALRVGILQIAPSLPDGEVRFYIGPEMYAQIHFDKSNEHVSEGVGYLMSKSWQVQNDATFPISRREYQSLARPLQA